MDVVVITKEGGRWVEREVAQNEEIGGIFFENKPGSYLITGTLRIIAPGIVGVVDYLEGYDNDEEGRDRISLEILPGKSYRGVYTIPALGESSVIGIRVRR